MKKNGKKLLSLLLVLVMLLSLAPSAFAVEAEDAASEDEGFGSAWEGWEDEIPEEPAPAEEEQPAVEPAEEPVEEPAPAEEVPVIEEPAPAEEPVDEEPAPVEEPAVDEEIVIVEEEEPAEEEEEETFPANTFYYVGGSGLRVTVDAPEGAFPEDAVMTVTEIKPENVQKTVNNAGIDGTVLVAADISFADASGAELQPNYPVKVSITSAEAARADNVKVVHIDDDDVVSEVEQLPEIPMGTMSVQSVQSVSDARTLKFEANSFSVYAVVGDGDTSANARVQVNFNSKGSLIATMYVKNGDTAEELKTILYDPGAGVLGTGEKFLGWTLDTTITADSQRMTIDQVRTYMESLSITEGMAAINFNAVIGKTVTLTYLDETKVAIEASSAELIGSETSVEMTVNANAPAVDSEHHFEGWNLFSGGDNIVSAVDGEGTAVEPPYPNGTVLTITGNVVLSVYAPEGHWLIFNENGKGATYCAPRFLTSEEETALPRPASEMQRYGYSFVGWNTAADGSGDWWFKTDGSVESKFGGHITEHTTLYAIWTPAATANYTIVIWKQNVAGNGYDFEESIPLTGTTNTAITTVTQTGADVQDVIGTYKNFVINGVEKSYIGFHGDHSDLTADTKITPEGNTVVNVYYNRNMIELRFWRFNATNGYTQETGTPTTGVAYYGRFSRNNVPSNSGSNYYRVYLLTNGNYGYPTNLDYYGGYYTYDENGQYVVTYSGNLYYRSGSWGQLNNLTMRGLYGSTLADNNKTWPTDYNWYSNGYNGGGVGGTRTTFLDAFLPTSNSSIVNFYGQTPEGTLTITFYKQNADLNGYTVANTVNATAGTFYLSDKYTGFQCAEWSADGGNTWTQVGSLDEIDGQYYYDADKNQSGHQDISYTTNLRIRFNRLAYKINYADGTYFDGNNNVLDEARTSGFGESELITYGASIAAYGDKNDTEHYKVPTRDGYVFDGWYADETCRVPYSFTTMPLDGVTVFAKWHQIQYRVFLHPNAGTDSTLSWGDEEQDEQHKQAMNFRISIGDKVSVPDGTRNGYKFLGWYLDPDYTNVFNDSAYVLNESTVTAAYDKTVDMTDPMDKFGNLGDNPYNSDANRPWITKKLDIYARWSAILIGADGIGVIYNAVDGTNAPTDTTLYIDTAKVVAGAASTAPAGMMFKHWVLQTWNGTEYVDTQITVEPGAEFTILKDNARDEDLGDGVHRYTVKLRAEYMEKEEETPTSITWYSNVQDSAGIALTKSKFGGATSSEYTDKGYFVIDDKGAEGDPLKINEAVEIRVPTTFTYPGYTFAGWAKLDKADDPDAVITTLDQIDPDNLFLKWDAENSQFLSQVGGSWVPVTHIAADERNPHQMMVAVWVGEFYIVHSGIDNAVANKITVPITKDILTNGKYDLTADLTAGTLYGGYYLGSVDGSVTPSTEAYDGDNWTWTTAAAAEKGNAITPVGGETYYIKEVPADEFLQPYTHYTYYKADGKIANLYMVSDIDDCMYKQTGFVISDDGNNKAYVCTSLTVKNAVGGNSVKITPVKVFGSKGATANDYLSYLDVTKIVAGNDFSVVQYWVTPDGLIVTGTVSRALSGITNKDTIQKKDDSTLDSTIAVFTGS